MRWLVFGSKGWIGQQICQLLESKGETVLPAESRAIDEIAVEKEVIDKNPDRIISLIGRTSGPGFTTIDYLEQKGKLIENLNDNLFGPFVLANIAKKHDIHLSYMGTGCIFNGYKDGIGYKEEDKPDFFGSSYSAVKGITDRMMHFYDNDVLNLRIRMPITADKNPKNFITKIMTYKKICSTPNSMSVLPELLPIMIDMATNKTVGTFNFTNPGMITHNEILEMVREIVDPSFKWENFTIEEQRQILLADRSNDYLNTDKLQSLYPKLTPIKDSIRNVLYDLKKSIDNSL